MCNRLLPLAVLLAACAHTQPAEMTASQHRAEAARHQAEADRLEHATDTQPVFGGPARSPFTDDLATLRPYNPSAARLAEADRQLQSAYEHLKSAQQLETFEAQACVGVPAAERRACPVLAPHLAFVEEVAQGLVLHLKPSAPTPRLAAQLDCHLAWAAANGFDRAPCPLFVKGVRITATADAIDFRSTDPAVAGQVRAEGRKLFGAERP